MHGGPAKLFQQGPLGGSKRWNPVRLFAKQGQNVHQRSRASFIKYPNGNGSCGELAESSVAPMTRMRFYRKNLRSFAPSLEYNQAKDQCCECSGRDIVSALIALSLSELERPYLPDGSPPKFSRYASRHENHRPPRLSSRMTTS